MCGGILSQGTYASVFCEDFAKHIPVLLSLKYKISNDGDLSKKSQETKVNEIKIINSFIARPVGIEPTSVMLEITAQPLYQGRISPS